jgi:hypothetical protein
MATTPYLPTQDPEKIPSTRIEEPDYDEPIVDPDGGELPQDEPEDEDEEQEPEDQPVRA